MKDKSVVGICEHSKKKCFESYTDCLKFARRVTRNNRARAKSLGREGYRNVPKFGRNDLQLWKNCKSIYKCKCCGYWHFSSVNKPLNKK